jgi:hypothetical protein
MGSEGFASYGPYNATSPGTIRVLQGDRTISDEFTVILTSLGFAENDVITLSGEEVLEVSATTSTPPASSPRGCETRVCYRIGLWRTCSQTQRTGGTLQRC